MSEKEKKYPQIVLNYHNSTFEVLLKENIKLKFTSKKTLIDFIKENSIESQVN